MPTVNDTLDAVLLGCFLFGLLFTVVVLVVGDAGLGSDTGSDGGGDTDGFLPLNLSTVLAFLTWFGGIAYLMRQAVGLPAAVSLVVGIGGGLVGATAVAWIMAKLVSSPNAEMKAEDYRLPGTIARVTSSIRAGGTGEVVYEQGGVRHVSAARATHGRAIPRGAEVIVIDRKGGIAMVEPADAFFGEEAAVVAGGGDPSATHPAEAR